MESTTAAIAPEAEPAADAQQPFYVVSEKKFLQLYLATFGLYEFYWFYQNWRLQKLENGESTIPVLRAIFSIFFMHDLCRRVDRQLHKNARHYYWSPRTLALWYVILSLAGNLLDRAAGKNILSPYSDSAAIPVLLVSAWIVYQVQRAINVACGDPAGSANERLTRVNYAWMAFGIVVWVLILIGIYAAIWHPEFFEEG